MDAPLVPAAARTLAIFEAFARERRELSNAELAQCIGVAESSCSDLVKTLIDLGYLARTPRHRRLYPTARLASVTAKIDLHQDRQARLDEACNALRNGTGESALCGQLGKRSVTVVAFSPGNYPLRYTSACGDRISLHVSALAKAILTQMPDDAVVREIGSRPYPKVASATVTEPDALLRQIVSLRKKGWVLLENESSDSLAAMAIAGRVDGELLAFSVAGPQPRITANQERYLEALREVGRQVFDAEGAPPASASPARGKRASGG